MTNVFIKNEMVQWEEVDKGVRRSILAFDPTLMVVKVKFEKEAIGALHQHVHVQISYVESGVFEVEIEGVKTTLEQGDTFFVPSNLWHGVVCKQAGVLIDSFSPMRQDFIK
jgi:quercetin dioxygenase-like cupin family protein